MDAQQAAAQTYWDGRARTFDRDYEALPIRARVTRRVLELMRPAPGETFLDLGVGTGRLYRDNVDAFRDSRGIVGVDLSPEMLEHARRELLRLGLAPFQPVLASYVDLEIPRHSIDCAVSVLALHHVTHADKVSTLARLRESVKPDGRLVIADQINCTGEALDPDALQRRMVRTFFPQLDETEALARTSHHPEYTASLPDFVAMVQAAGFHVQHEVLTDFVAVIHTV